MKDLPDYSGEFRPDLKFTDFSKEALIRMWEAAANLYIGINQIWMGFVQEKMGEETAKEWLQAVWSRGIAMEYGLVTGPMNIHGDDVATLFKAWQCNPGPLSMDIEYSLKDAKHGTITVKRCPFLEILEAADMRDWMKLAIAIDQEGFEHYAKSINPKMKVTPLKLPPRKSKDEVACQWEFAIAD